MTRIFNGNIVGSILLGFLLYQSRIFVEIIYHPLQIIFASLGVFFVYNVISIYKNVEPKLKLDKDISYILIAYLIYIFFIVFRNVLFFEKFDFLMIYPYYTYGLYSYGLMFLTLNGSKLLKFNLIYEFVKFFSIVGLVYFILNFGNFMYILAKGNISRDSEGIGIAELAVNYNYWLTVSFFSLLCYNYLNKAQKILVIVATLFSLLLMVILARRGGVLINSIYFISAYILLNYRKSNFFVKFFTAIIFLLIVISILSVTTDFFSFLNSRIQDDTRGGVDLDIIMHLDINNLWIFGGGMSATYRAAGFEELRYEHETGYLYLILKGGLVYLVFYVYLLLHAAVKGIFDSNNLLSKGLGLYLFIHIIYLIPFGLPGFEFEYFLVWVSFIFCEIRFLRKLDEIKLSNYFVFHHA